MTTSLPALRRVVRSALLGCALLVLGTACACKPEPADWLAAGATPFRTPELAFRTFRTALGGDEVDLEYRCLSSGFRRRNGGLTQIMYREFREDLLRQNPWLRRASCARTVETRELSERNVEVLAEASALFKTVRFRIGYVREDFYELYAGIELLEGPMVDDMADVVRELTAPSGVVGASLWLPLPPFKSAVDVTHLRVGQEWKIDSFELVTDEPSP